MIDDRQTLVTESAYDYAQVTATGNGNIIDMAGYESLTYVLYIDTVTTADSSNYFTFTVYGDSDSAMGTQVVLASTDIIGTAWVINENSATYTDDTTHEIGVKCSVAANRYYRLTCTETLTADATFAVIAIKGHALTKPTS